jgi:hypothetical protein
VTRVGSAIPVGQNPQAIAVDQGGVWVAQRLYEASGNISVRVPPGHYIATGGCTGSQTLAPDHQRTTVPTLGEAFSLLTPDPNPLAPGPGPSHASWSASSVPNMGGKFWWRVKPTFRCCQLVQLGRIRPPERRHHHRVLRRRPRLPRHRWKRREAYGVLRLPHHGNPRSLAQSTLRVVRFEPRLAARQRPGTQGVVRRAIPAASRADAPGDRWGTFLNARPAENTVPGACVRDVP